MRWLCLILLFPALVSTAQDRCPEGQHFGSPEFENWMMSKQLERQFLKSTAQTSQIYTVPVVVHVVHNGEAVGVGTNISDERIFRQIEVLNEDFRRQNADAANTLPEFQGVAADIEIQFVLARQDPNGLPTTGIVRVQGSQSSYPYQETNSVLKNQSAQWDPNDYLNIWVADLSSGLLGWSSWPDTDLQPQGLGWAPSPANQEGVAVDYAFFGDNPAAGSFASYGRTLTHEMGHFFGLLHTFSGGCESNGDYCADTPSQQFSTSTTESCPLSQVSCGSLDMVQNYMDYSADVCMNLFTNDQKARMRTVIENSPRRKTLTTSPGLQSPIPPDFDLAIQAVQDLPLVSCNHTHTPTLVLTNLGLETIENVVIQKIQNGSSSMIELADLSILHLQSVYLPVELAGLNNGTNSISFQILEINGAPDENPVNDFFSRSVTITGSGSPSPFREDFNSTQWLTGAMSGSQEWEKLSLEGTEVYAIRKFNQPTNVESWLISNLISLEDQDEAGLFGRMSYKRRSGFQDQLRVYVSVDCGTTFQLINTINLEDYTLFDPTTNSWTPSNASVGWKEFFTNLSAYVGQTIRVAYSFTNKGGNNFFLSNVEITNNASAKQPRPIDSFVVYPNPGNGRFKVTLNLEETVDKVTFQLFDQSGKLVLEEQRNNILNQTFEVVVPDYLGSYFLRIKAGNFEQTQRILISR
jgi:hypothetical protein